MNKKIVFSSVIILAVVIVAALVLYNGKGIDKEMGIDVLKQAENDSVAEADLDGVMEKLGYEIYSNSTYESKHAYVKNEGDKVTLEKANQGEVSEYEYLFIKDYSTESDDVSFVLTKTTKSDRFIYSIAKDKNTILIEKTVYEGDTVSYEHYNYNVEKNEFKFVNNGNSDKKGSIKYGDIKDDLNKYFDEFTRIYEK